MKFSTTSRWGIAVFLLLLCGIQWRFASSRSLVQLAPHPRHLAVRPLDTTQFYFEFSAETLGLSRLHDVRADLPKNHFKVVINCPSSAPSGSVREVALLVYLHGAGEAGTDPRTVLQALGAAGSLPQLVARQNVMDEDPLWDAASAQTATHPLLNGAFPAIVVAPQSTVGWPFDASGIRAVRRLVASLLQGPAAELLKQECQVVINKKKVVVTGASQGGYGAMRLLAMTNPVRDAQPVPLDEHEHAFQRAVTHVVSLSGFSQDANEMAESLLAAARDRHVKLLLVHGLNDDMVPAQASLEIMEALVRNASTMVSEVRVTTIEESERLRWDMKALVNAVWMKKANSAPDAPHTGHSSMRDVFAASSPFWAWLS